MRRRLVRLAVLAATVAVVLFGLPLAVAVTQYAQIYKLLDLERLADRAALRVAASLSDDGAPSAEELRDDATLTYLSVYDHDGAFLRGRGPDPADRFVDEAMDGISAAGTGRDELVVAVPVTHDGEVVGAIRIAGPTRALLWPVAAAWAGLVGLAVLAVGVVWLIARRQAVKLARPLEELTEAAQRLGDGDFAVRLAAVDVLEIDAAGNSLNRTAARLDDLLARERAFSAEASHQLRTPLTSLRLRLETALDGTSEELRSAVTAGLRSAERIEHTIDELLSLARDTRSDVAPVDVGRFVGEAVQQRSADFTAVRRNLRTVIEPEVPHASVSIAALRQVLAVLLDNSLTHGAGTVEVTVRDAGDVVAVDVSDEGPGISLPDSALFERRSPSAAGTGIGLALARRLAEAEGGHLRLARPAPPVFTLLLPAANPH